MEDEAPQIKVLLLLYKCGKSLRKIVGTPNNLMYFKRYDCGTFIAWSGENGKKCRFFPFQQYS